MPRSVKIYYGLSGTFKSTTIKQLFKPGDNILWSGIKQWKQWETGILGLKNSPSDLNFALLHLSRLKDNEYSIIKDSTTFHIERGVSDMVFYWLLSNPAESFETMLFNLVKEEIEVSKFVSGSNSEPKKILLVQKDYDFIRDVVLSEKTRAERFPGGVDDYLKAQDLYIDFTKKFNNIDEIIEITDARNYLERLGIKYIAE